MMGRLPLLSTSYKVVFLVRGNQPPGCTHWFMGDKHSSLGRLFDAWASLYLHFWGELDGFAALCLASLPLFVYSYVSADRSVCRMFVLCDQQPVSAQGFHRSCTSDPAPCDFL